MIVTDCTGIITIFSKGTENITIFCFNGIFHIKEENEEFDKIPDNSILELHTGTISFLLIPLRGCRGREQRKSGGLVSFICIFPGKVYQ
jgi:hypothetical protein